jgi:hypothetical protein
MLTETEDVEAGLACAEINKLDAPYSDSEYPQELIDEWDRESDLIELEIENGVEIKSIDEQFAEHGF